MGSLEHLLPAVAPNEHDLNLKESNLKQFLNFLQQELKKPELPKVRRQQLGFLALAILLILSGCAPDRSTTIEDFCAQVQNNHHLCVDEGVIEGGRIVSTSQPPIAASGPEPTTGDAQESESAAVFAGATYTIQPGQTLFEISRRLVKTNLAPVPTPQYNPDARTHYEEYARQILTHLLVDHIVQTNGNVTNPRKLPVGQTIQLPSQETINQLHSQARQRVEANLR